MLTALLLLPAGAGANGIKIDARPGVSSTHFKYITLAINNITRFFSDNYKLALQKKMRIIIVPDDKTYESILISEFGFNPVEARKDARHTAGRAHDGKTEYLLMLKAQASDSMPWLIELACHEIVHWYQFQVAGVKKVHELKWLAEGSATVIAYQIVQSMTDSTMEQYFKKNLAALKQGKQVPSLKELRSPKDWKAASDRCGPYVVYRKAILAVQELARQQGVEALFNYFLNLPQYPPAQAFERTFGLNLQRFEADMDQKFRRQQTKLAPGAHFSRRPYSPPVL